MGGAEQGLLAYGVALDRNGDLWIGGMNADRILRMSTETGKLTEYPLPRSTNIRRVFVDNATTPPTFGNHQSRAAGLIGPDLAARARSTGALGTLLTRAARR